MRRWRRRDFLRAAGIGATAAMLPLVPSRIDAQSGPPKRLILLSHGNGSVLQSWRDNGNQRFVSDAALPALRGPILEPLDDHRQKLLLVDGIDIADIFGVRDGRFRRVGAGGHAGSSALFTGVMGGGQQFDGDAGSFSSGTSVDQVINEQIGEGRRTLQLGIYNRPFDPRSVYNYDQSATPLPLETNPQAAFDAVFRNGFGDATPAGRDRPAERRRILDVMRGEIGRLRQVMPSGDRERLDQHLESIDSLEQRLSVAPSIMCSAGPDDRPTFSNPRADTPATSSAMQDVLIHAMACDQVRVATLQLVPENSWGSAPFLPEWGMLGGGGVHTTSHGQNQEASSAAREAAVDRMTALNRWVTERVVELLDRLETAGLMDDTVVLWAPAMSHGGYHSNQNVPVVIAQGANGPFRANRYVRFGDYEQEATGGSRSVTEAGNESNNNLLISLCHGFGLNHVESFGAVEHCRPEGLDSWLL